METFTDFTSLGLSMGIPDPKEEERKRKKAEEARRKKKEAELRERREIERLQKIKERLEQIGWPLTKIKADKKGAINYIEEAQMASSSNRIFGWWQEMLDFVVQC